MKIGAGCEWDVAKVEYNTNTPPIRAAIMLAIALMRATFIPSLMRLDLSGLASSFIAIDILLQLVLSLVNEDIDPLHTESYADISVTLLVLLVFLAMLRYRLVYRLWL